MTLQISSAVAQRFVAPFADLFNGGTIFLYDGGTRPATADIAATAIPVAMITHLGLPWNPSFTPYGLRFTQLGRGVVFAPEITAQLSVLRPPTGIAWWRLVAPGDDGTDTNYDKPRIDGDVGLKSAPGGQELLLDSVTPSIGTVVSVGYFLYAIPPLF
jgi:hypothetical protein